MTGVECGFQKREWRSLKGCGRFALVGPSLFCYMPMNYNYSGPWYMCYFNGTLMRLEHVICENVVLE